MKGRIRFLTTDFLFLLAALVAASAIAFVYSARLGITVGLFCIAYAALYIAFGIIQKVKWQKLAMKTLSDRDTFSTYLDTMSIPTALTTPTGSIKWSNYAFRQLAGYGAMRNIAKMIPGINVPERDKKILIDGKPYKKEIFTVHYKAKDMLLYRLVDVGTAVEAKKLYQNFLPAVCYIQIDNYDELAADLLQTELSELEAAVERRISEMTKSLSSVFIKTGRGRYLAVFERRFLSTLRASKFRVLDDVRQLKADSSPTLSIAIGVGDTPEQSADYAGKALELALGRGGDQAVIKQGDKFIFFGGMAKTPLRRSKVKSRTISHALRSLIEQCGDVFIMGHESPDADSIGAALGIAACARYTGKNAYIVMGKPNQSVKPLLSKLSDIDSYEGAFITPQEAGSKISAQSMLVVVDTFVPGNTVAPNLIELAETVVVIDHHLKGAAAIEKAALVYHEPYASSASELVTELMEYYGEGLKPLPVELEALLCGITIDTKGFSFNAGARTFEAASYLKRAGADSAAVVQLIQDDYETYAERTSIVRSAEIFDNGIAIAICPKIENAALVSAQAADELMTLRGVNASFVVSSVDDGSVISGRSLGDVNVQLILESLGGGGHVTMAAVKLAGISPETAYQRLKQAINNYVKED